MTGKETNSLVTKIIDNALEFYKDDCNKKQGRYRSWDYCFETFKSYRAQACSPEGLSEHKKDYLCLLLGFYLASWGMMRGSFLLQMNYKIHEKIIDEILKPEYNDLVGISCAKLLESSNLAKLQQLIEKIESYYEEKRHEVKGDVAASLSITLITKILLGTLACVPAFDVYFVATLKEYKDDLKLSRVTQTSKNLSETVKELAQFYLDSNFDELLKNQNKYECLKIYPPMKLLDMGFWQIENHKRQMAKEENKAKKN